MRRQLEPLVVGSAHHGGLGPPVGASSRRRPLAAGPVDRGGRAAGQVPAARPRRRARAGRPPRHDRAAAAAAGRRVDPYVRAWWALDDGAVLELRDVRRFGRIGVVPAGEYASLPTLAAQGPEPWDPVLDDGGLWRHLRRSRARVKTQLLSQRPLAGVGNIYADEALWRAGIHPARRSVTRAEAARLLRGAARGARAGHRQRRHDAARLPHGRRRARPQPARARLLRPGRRALPAAAAPSSAARSSTPAAPPTAPPASPAAEASNGVLAHLRGLLALTAARTRSSLWLVGLLVRLWPLWPRPSDPASARKPKQPRPRSGKRRAAAHRRRPADRRASAAPSSGHARRPRSACCASPSGSWRAWAIYADAAGPVGPGARHRRSARRSAGAACCAPVAPGRRRRAARPRPPTTTTASRSPRPTSGSAGCWSRSAAAACSTSPAVAPASTRPTDDLAGAGGLARRSPSAARSRRASPPGARCSCSRSCALAGLVVLTRDAACASPPRARPTACAPPAPRSARRPAPGPPPPLLPRAATTAPTRTTTGCSTCSTRTPTTGTTSTSRAGAGARQPAGPRADARPDVPAEARHAARDRARPGRQAARPGSCRRANLLHRSRLAGGRQGRRSRRPAASSSTRSPSTASRPGSSAWWSARRSPATSSSSAPA